MGPHIPERCWSGVRAAHLWRYELTIKKKFGPYAPRTYGVFKAVAIRRFPLIRLLFFLRLLKMLGMLIMRPFIWLVKFFLTLLLLLNFSSNGLMELHLPLLFLK